MSYWPSCCGFSWLDMNLNGTLMFGERALTFTECLLYARYFAYVVWVTLHSTPIWAWVMPPRSQDSESVCNLLTGIQLLWGSISLQTWRGLRGQDISTSVVFQTPEKQTFVRDWNHVGPSIGHISDTQSWSLVSSVVQMWRNCYETKLFKIYEAFFFF